MIPAHLIKKILYRAHYRGSKQVEKIIIAFVNTQIASNNDQNLNLLLEFLEQDDLALFSVDKLLSRNKIETDFYNYLIDIQWFSDKFS